MLINSDVGSHEGERAFCRFTFRPVFSVAHTKLAASFVLALPL